MRGCSLFVLTIFITAAFTRPVLGADALAVLGGSVSEGVSSGGVGVAPFSDSKTIPLNNLPISAISTASAASDTSTGQYAISADAHSILAAISESQAITVGEGPLGASGTLRADTNGPDIILPLHTNSAQSSGSIEFITLSAATPYEFQGFYNTFGSVVTSANISLVGASTIFSFGGGGQSNVFPYTAGFLPAGTYIFQYSLVILDGSNSDLDGPGTGTADIGLIVGAAVPEPTSVAIIILGCIFVLHRRPRRSTACHY